MLVVHQIYKSTSDHVDCSTKKKTYTTVRHVVMAREYKACGSDKSVSTLEDHQLCYLKYYL